MANENEFLFYALIMGIFITFIYDWLRIVRRVIPHKSFMISLEDIGFWIYCAIEVFLLMYHESDGTLRWFAVLGAMVGMLVYKKLISGLFVKYVSMVLQKIFGFLLKFIKIILKPFHIVGKSTTHVTKQTLKKTGRGKQFLKKKLTYFLKVLKMNL